MTFGRICRVLGNGRVPCAETFDPARLRGRGDGCGDHAWLMGFAFVCVLAEGAQGENGHFDGRQGRLPGVDCAAPSSDGNRLGKPEGRLFYLL